MDRVSTAASSLIAVFGRDRCLQFSDRVARQELLFGQCDSEPLLDGHHTDREGHRIQSHIVDQPGIRRDSSQVNVEVVAQDAQQRSADGGRR